MNAKNLPRTNRTNESTNNARHNYLSRSEFGRNFSIVFWNCCCLTDILVTFWLWYSDFFCSRISFFLSFSTHRQVQIHQLFNFYYLHTLHNQAKYTHIFLNWNVQVKNRKEYPLKCGQMNQSTEYKPTKSKHTFQKSE